MSGLECCTVVRTVGGGVLEFATTSNNGVGMVTISAPGMKDVKVLVTASEATRVSVAAGRLSFDISGPVEIDMETDEDD